MRSQVTNFCFPSFGVELLPTGCLHHGQSCRNLPTPGVLSGIRHASRDMWHMRPQFATHYPMCMSY
eukprot:6515870-Alexandrium_andersonii.AAC.1